MNKTAPDSTTNTDGLRIDVESVLRSRGGRIGRMMPRFIVSWLERVICQERLNQLLTENAHLSGVDFCRGLIKSLDVEYTINGTFPATDRPLIVSNHPLGGLDGIILAAAVQDAYPGLPIHLVVNDLLHAVGPMRNIFLSVNKHGAQSRQNAQALEDAMAAPGPIVMFPAGMVSRRNSSGQIADLRWHKMAIQKAVAHQRNIVPLYFSGQNSAFFYNFARLRTLLGIKFNIEMIRLPHELCHSQGKKYQIHVGNPIPWPLLQTGTQAQQQADQLRQTVYDICQQQLQPTLK